MEHKIPSGLREVSNPARTMTSFGSLDGTNPEEIFFSTYEPSKEGTVPLGKGGQMAQPPSRARPDSRKINDLRIYAIFYSSFFCSFTHFLCPVEIGLFRAQILLAFLAFVNANCLLFSTQISTKKICPLIQLGPLSLLHTAGHFSNNSIFFFFVKFFFCCPGWKFRTQKSSSMRSRLASIRKTKPT